MKRPEISVVIPVYNGEKYLATTLDSLLRQTFSNFEALCINDCSTDSSEATLLRYASSDRRIRVLRTETNQGIVPKVIQSYGLPNVQGTYYVYSSQDDLFSDDWLEKMWLKAVETGADAVLPDVVFYHEHDSARDRSLVGLHGNRDVVLTNEQAVVYSLDWRISTNALWRTSLVREIGYEDFGMYADEYSERVFFYHCNKVVFCDGVFYYRQDNPDAITKKPGYKSCDLPYTEFRLFQFVEENGFESEVCRAELRRAVESLLSQAQHLAMARAVYSEEEMREGEARIRACYEAIAGCQTARTLLGELDGSARLRIKVHALRYGYFVFRVSSNIVALLRRLRGLASFERARGGYGHGRAA